MKRAAVWKGTGSRRRSWWACVVPAEEYEPGGPMPLRASMGVWHEHDDFPTHAAALAHALAAVGLAPEEER